MGDNRVNEITIYLLKFIEYVDYESLLASKKELFDGNTEDSVIIDIVMFASYVGTLKRLAYYKFVHKKGIDVRYLFDACIKAFMFNGVYRFELSSNYRKLVKSHVDKTIYPKWTKLGLLGGTTKDLIELGNEFSSYMDDLNI